MEVKRIKGEVYQLMLSPKEYAEYQLNKAYARKKGFVVTDKMYQEVFKLLDYENAKEKILDKEIEKVKQYEKSYAGRKETRKKSSSKRKGSVA